ncbi:flagellar biosynthetic protein FliP [Dissulfurispira thermophila]|uniref:Flagellar biosynthetic protein FliP n=1 Tax=Dissulfurispira thermophila TaxID=2715679 RepID=A0A7G1H2U2_9BACT|nr:flagellar type III secretion system pore protein FliP [Dissulfurispira thermophila]BCB96461.1 flagellar biosynthetic protein FliP [Dissulfurispira thermophila]
MGFELIKVTIALLIILGGLYLFIRFLKQRVLPNKGFIEIIQYQPFGPKKGIAVVKVLKEYLILGIADEGISLLSKPNPSDVEEALQKTEDRSQKSEAKIKDLIKSKLFFFFLLFSVFCPLFSFAAPAPPPPAGGGFLGLTTPLELLLFLTLLSILPAILVMTTCFTRIVVVLSFLRQALGTPQVPPTQVIIGLSLFITLFVMSPVIDRIYADAYQPYTKKEINAEEALNRAGVPLKEFMLKQTREKDLALFFKMSKSERPATPMDLPMRVVIPAFAIGELKKAFEIGFLIFLPFLVIDMVVASVLLSMGMMMLPPIMVSMPFKLLLFVLVDGWDLLIGSLVGGYR